MAQKKVWEFEGDWYIQVGENLPFCINTEEVANELANHISKQVEKPVKPANDGNIFEMNIYTGRVNGSDIHQKEEQHILFTAKSKKQIEYLIDELCRVIRQTDNTNTHNEIIAGIIGEANSLSV